MLELLAKSKMTDTYWKMIDNMFVYTKNWEISIKSYIFSGDQQYLWKCNTSLCNANLFFSQVILPLMQGSRIWCFNLMLCLVL